MKFIFKNKKIADNTQKGNNFLMAKFRELTGKKDKKTTINEEKREIKEENPTNE